MGRTQLPQRHLLHRGAERPRELRVFNQRTIRERARTLRRLWKNNATHQDSHPARYRQAENRIPVENGGQEGLILETLNNLGRFTEMSQHFDTHRHLPIHRSHSTGQVKANKVL